MTYDEQSTMIQLALPLGESEEANSTPPSSEITSLKERALTETEAAIIEELKSLNLNHLPPIEALAMLYRWQEQLNKKEQPIVENEVAL